MAAKSNTRIAIDKLRTLIFDGVLSPGSDHLESELAARLGMSRTPVREALVALEAQGLLQVRARRGVRILPISIRDMQEIYDVLTELESMAAAQAAARRPKQEALGELTRAIYDMEAALAAEDRDAWAAADERFHSELMRLGGNSRAVAIVAMLADQVRRAKAVTLYLRPLPTKSNKDHRGVLDAIREGDPERAKELHRTHRVDAGKMLVSLLKEKRLTNL